MAQSLVGSYSIETTDNEIYYVDFSIPDNCEFTIRGSAGAFTIIVQLKRGQTTPSTTFTDYKETFTSSGGTISIDFEQVSNQATVIKPRIRVDFI